MSKYEVVTINNKLVSIDLSELIKKENLFFNATEIAKQFGKRPQHYLDTQQTKDLINVILEAEKTAPENLIKITKGGKNQGTWLHQTLAIDFARWCSPEFAYSLDKWILSKLQEEKERKQSRALSKLEYPDLTYAIQEFLLTGKDSDKWLYSNEADMINKLVLGCKAKKYCDLNGIDRVSLRDNLNSGQINLIQQLQKFDTALIQAGLDHETRKEKLEIRYAQLVAKLIN